MFLPWLPGRAQESNSADQKYPNRDITDSQLPYSSEYSKMRYYWIHKKREFLNFSADTVDFMSRSVDYPSLSSILRYFMFTQVKYKFLVDTRQEQSRHRPSNLNSLEQNKADQKRIIPNRFLINVTISSNRKFKCKILKLWNSWKFHDLTTLLMIWTYPQKWFFSVEFSPEDFSNFQNARLAD